MVLKHIEMGNQREAPAQAGGAAGKFTLEHTPQPAEETSTPRSPAQRTYAGSTAGTQGGGAVPGTRYRFFRRAEFRSWARKVQKIISVNAVNLPLHLKLEGDPRTYTMELAIKIDSLIPED